MIRCGILGGSFNPPTYAHLQIGVFARGQFSLEKILLVPCSVSGFSDKNVVESQHHRYNMTLLASSELDDFEVLNVDLFKNEPVYAFESVAMIKKLCPDDDLFYIAGSDSIASVTRWKNPEEFVSGLEFIIAEREGVSVDDAFSSLKELNVDGSKIHELNYPTNNISSTIVRKRLEENLGCDCLVPPSVLRYISVHRLYKKEGNSGR